jgi:hypothetical protein
MGSDVVPATDRGSVDGERGEIRRERVRVLRLGHGGNCSSVGSVIDTLFIASAVGGAIFAAVCAAMREEPIRVVGQEGEVPAEAEEGE